jgi:hypothetical protein
MSMSSSPLSQLFAWLCPIVLNCASIKQATADGARWRDGKLGSGGASPNCLAVITRVRETRHGRFSLASRVQRARTEHPRQKRRACGQAPVPWKWRARLHPRSMDKNAMAANGRQAVPRGMLGQCTNSGDIHHAIEYQVLGHVLTVGSSSILILCEMYIEILKCDATKGVCSMYNESDRETKWELGSRRL